MTSSLIGYTCEDGLPVKINITCLIFIPYKTSAYQAVALVYYISASIKIVLNVEQTSACFVVNMNLINSTKILYDEH